VPISIFAVPKPFEGSIAALQRNALRTWKAISGAELLLLGGEHGAAAAAREFGADAEPEVARTEAGAPLVSDVFERAERWASHRSLLYVNADVLLPPETAAVVDRVRRTLPGAVCVGECSNVEIAGELQGWSEAAGAPSVARGVGGIDYLAFERGTFPRLPPFALGRAFFDNWLLWDARRRSIPIVDVTHVLRALHQNHGYEHVRGGRTEAYEGVDARRNYELAGGQLHLFNIDDATHRLTDDGLRRNRVAGLRAVPAIRWLALAPGRMERAVRRA
jgi:hypothetical protein